MRVLTVILIEVYRGNRRVITRFVPLTFRVISVLIHHIRGNGSVDEELMLNGIHGILIDWAWKNAYFRNISFMLI